MWHPVWQLTVASVTRWRPLLGIRHPVAASNFVAVRLECVQRAPRRAEVCTRKAFALQTDELAAARGVRYLGDLGQ